MTMTEQPAAYTVVQSAIPARAYMLTRAEARIDVIVCGTYTDDNGVLIARVYSADDDLQRVFEIKAERIQVEPV